MSRLTFSLSASLCLIVAIGFVGDAPCPSSACMGADSSADESSPHGDFNHRSNNARTGFTAAEFRPPFQLAWTHKFPHVPRPAWREPAWETQRIDGDYAFPIAADRQTVYVASSVDHAIHALDRHSGQPRWRFFTEGPVRLPPTVHQGKVYFTSDDGNAYCLEATRGNLRWKHSPNVPDERLIGNEQIIDRWPARSGVLVEDGRAYTTFGMWSAEGIVIACLAAETGEVIWQNDSSGTRYMTQPHFEAMGGVSPQGPLALSGDVLVVPCGRAAPAFFDSQTGQLLYNEAEGLFPGGEWTMAFGDLTFTPCEFLKKPNPVDPEGPEARISDEASLVALRSRTGEEVFHLHGALRGVIDVGGQMTLIGPQGLVNLALEDVLRAAPGGYQAKRGSSEGHFVEVDEHKRWATPTTRVYELVQAGSTLIAGGRGALTCYNADDGQQLWQTQLKGDVRQLLVARDSLLVSTSAGEVHCFVAKRRGTPEHVATPVRQIAVDAPAREHVASLLSAAGVNEGYGFVLGEVSSEYLASLAQQSDLAWHWAAQSPDLQATRAKLADAGLYGTRVTIHRVTASRLPYADYAANLLVWEVRSADDLQQVSAAEIYRLLRPDGGKAVISCDEALRPLAARWLASAGLSALETEIIDDGLIIRRGPLTGAGAWTHQYADAGKSGNSGDPLVRLPLKVLWFGSIGPADMISRHYRTPAPLATGGRMFVAGREFLHAVDAYNGRLLWQREIPGVGRWPAAYRGGCIAADTEAVYALDQNVCLRLDPQSGQTRLTYRPPQDIRPEASSSTAEEPVWEYLAVAGDVIVGTLGEPNIRRSWWSMAHPANHLLFALDKATGEPQWSYQAQSAIDSSAIAVDGERLFLIDGLAKAEVFRAMRRGQSPVQKNQKAVFRIPGASHTRALRAVNLKSGELLWESTKIGPMQNSVSVADGVVLVTAPVWQGLSARTEGPGIAAFSVEDGEQLWTKENPVKPPVIVNQVVYLPEAHDLRTGVPMLRKDPLTGEMTPFSAGISGGCAQLAGCEQTLMRRSGSLGFYDLAGQSGVYHFPNMRASCWVNMIPACGLVLVPEGSSSCPCSYNYKTSIALMPASRHNHWGLYTPSKRPKRSTIEHLQLNFGAPGDKQHGDQAEGIWFAFPRPSTVGPRGAGGMGAVPYDPLSIVAADPASKVTTIFRNPDWTPIGKTDQPWLYSCGLVGPLRLSVQLAGEASTTRRYRVTLHFCELRDRDPGGTFNVRLQGEKVMADVNIGRQTGQTNQPLVRDFTIEAAESLTLELVGKADALPIINAMQVERLRSSR